MKSTRVFKPLFVRLNIALFYVVILLIPGVLAAAQDSPLSQILLGMIVLLALLGIYDASQVRLEIREDSVLVRNLLRKYEIGWDQVRDIGVRRPWRIWQGWGAGVPALAVITPGKTVVCDASVNLSDSLRRELLAWVETEAKAHGLTISASLTEFTRA